MEVKTLKSPKAGAILLSEPFMHDQNFKRSVVLLCEHQDDGSLGFILNKPIQVKLNDAIEDFPPFDAELHFGGPVQTDTLHYLHNQGEMIEGSIRLNEGLYWGGNFETIKILAATNRIKPTDFKFFVGYSGWGEGQLMAEMETNSWIIVNGHADHIFNHNPENLWKSVLKNMGGRYSMISGYPENPQYN